MTVAELLEILKDAPESAEVVVEGFNISGDYVGGVALSTLYDAYSNEFIISTEEGDEEDAY